MQTDPPVDPLSLALPEHTLAQLDDMVRHGHFVNHQDAIAVAVERLYAEEESRHMTTRQAAFTRLCGALQLGTLVHAPTRVHVRALARLQHLHEEIRSGRCPSVEDLPGGQCRAPPAHRQT